MAEIKLIALDLDGTLLNDDKKLTAENEQVLKECIARGIYIVPATGRTVNGIPDVVKDIPGVRYAITINGGKVVDMEDNKIISSCLLTKEHTLEVMETAEKYPVMYDAYIEGRGVSEERFLNHMDDYGITPGIQDLMYKTRDAYPSIIDHVKSYDGPIEKMNIFFRDSATRSHVREILSRNSHILVSSSMPNNLEINAAGATKGDGILRLAEYLGIPREQTMAFGDGENDISMIEKAGIGVVMENGAPFLKDMADYITISNENSGVAAAIRTLVLGQ
ncbi:Cof-type HAD-IIB family hydrolase [Clostridium sp. AM58-1XD]|uniref:Cof-type HAD-IIB family hydrolase n=1 Tax=Clostridium sp. AM58-1XD TaxID=2292307 RepID=UPI000E4826E9|nr:Cof-type HAD-IIB family hydrolase [Clostridium sp. AM58-1XD]RGY95054.1 HAD family phosphatase [Clostridium sp. AM58-1XD]